MKKNECIHKEILLGRWIVEIDGKQFEMCAKCYQRVRYLAGVRTIEWGTPRPLTELEKRNGIIRTIR